MKQEFSLVFEPTHFPFHVVYVPVFWSKMRGILSGHGYLPAGFYIQDEYYCIQKFTSQAPTFMM
jgi:hypothetical protein